MGTSAIQYRLTDEESDAMRCNLGLAYAYALAVIAKHHVQGQDQDDVIQAAMMGLIRGISKCDAEKGALSTIAEWHIRQQVQRAYHQKRMIHVPHYLAWRKGHKNHAAAGAAKVAIDADLGDDFDLAWLAKDREPDAIEVNETARYVAVAVQRLPDRERDVIERRMRGGTYKAIAAELGTVPSRVKDAERRAHAKLREMLADYA